MQTYPINRIYEICTWRGGYDIFSFSTFNLHPKGIAIYDLVDFVRAMMLLSVDGNYRKYEYKNY
ncbi:hypothetical protein [uncultured Algoriphagus sp.]|uniref:hypothetical protein n=1 Tax=uncultured Algoriphagus sp. TaxID=417365 RepID=UPI0030EBB782